MEHGSFLQGLRFVDSFFPSGGYAFSSGLEAAVQGGAIRTAEDLARYVQDYLSLGIGRREAVAVGIAHEAVLREKPDSAIDADRTLEAMQICRESRHASRQMGRQVIRIAGEQIDHPVLRNFLALVESGESPGHFPVTLGITLGAVGWSKADTIRAYLYQCSVGFVSASLKLLPIGQREAQRLLNEWTPLLDRVSLAAAESNELTAWCPVQDIYAMRHGGLTTRLFRS